MPLTLVTGANSFVAAHIIESLIGEGHIVIGSVRRKASGDVVLAEHPDWSDKLKFVEIADYAQPGIWDAIFKENEIDYVVHVAGSMLDNPANTDYDTHFLRPSVEGNLSLLRSAQQYASKLKSISVTGSINAITTGDDLASRELTNESWNSITKEQAREMNNAYISYCSAKKEAEEAIWSFVKEQRPSFGVTVFLPALIFGPPIQGVTATKALNFSAASFFGLFSGQNAGKPVPNTMFPSYIDVRDLATAHVRALTTPSARDKRFLIGGMPFSNTSAVHVLRERFANLSDKLPVGDESNVVVPKIRAEEGNSVLDMQFRSLEDTVVDMTAKILKIQDAELA